MTPEDWVSLKPLFEQALSLTPEERAAFVEKVRQQDEELGQKLADLIREDETRSFDRPFIDLHRLPPDSPIENETAPVDDTVTLTALRLGEVIAGRFRLVRHAGKGGMGEVFEAEDLQLKDRIALKVIRADLVSNPTACARFKREILLGKRVAHPNVCRIHDLGSAQSRDGSEILFLTMEFLSGETLASRIRRGPLSADEALPLIENLSDGLAAAHRAGIVHRDFKSGNVMLVSSADGTRAVVTDFGLAHAMIDREESTVLTTVGAVAGTVAFMAPEQLRGEELTAAADIYALGVVVFQMMTGRLPFDGDSDMSVALKHLNETPPPPRKFAPDLDAKWEAAILCCLSKAPEERFNSVDDFKAALVSGSSRTLRRLRFMAAKRRLIAIRPLAAAVVLAALAIPGYFWLRPKIPVADYIAVLPFDNRTGDPDLAYLVGGITESLIGDLSRIPTLRVSALGSVLKYQGRQVDARTAARELGAARVIDGSISKRDGGLFVDTELIDVQTGARTWGNAYSADLSSISEVLQRFSKEVTDQLRLRLSGPLRERLKRQYAVGSESYGKYLKARFHFNKRTAADFQQAIQLFEDVLATDPDYAPARAGLAATYARMAVFGPFWSGVEPRVALERARDAAQQALQLDGTLAEAYNALAMVEVNADYNWDAAESDYRRAIELNPSFGETHENYAFELAARGRSLDAIREIKLAEKLEPENSHFRAANGLILYMGRKYDESLNIYGDIAGTPEGAARVADVMAMNYWMKSMPTEALNVLDRIPENIPELRTPFTITAYCRIGKMDQARALYDKYYLNGGRAWWNHLAVAHLNMRRPDDAVQDLEKAFQERWGDVIWIGVDPMFDALHSNPGFRRLLVSVKLASKPM